MMVKLDWSENLNGAYSRGQANASRTGCLGFYRMSAAGPERRLVRRRDMSGVEVKADSKAMTAFGQN
jgi:hypothetical protein